MIVPTGQAGRCATNTTAGLPAGTFLRTAPPSCCCVVRLHANDQSAKGGHEWRHAGFDVDQGLSLPLLVAKKLASAWTFQSTLWTTKTRSRTLTHLAFVYIVEPDKNTCAGVFGFSSRRSIWLMQPGARHESEAK